MADVDPGARDDRAAVDKAFALLQAFRDDGLTGVGVSEMARRAGLSKSTAFRLLSMMERNGVVERLGSAYRLGNALYDLSSQGTSARHEWMKDVIMPYLVDLYETTHATVHLAVLAGTDAYCLTKLRGHHAAPSPVRVGGRIPAYCTAVGKVLLAADDNALAKTLSGVRRRLTSSTLTDEDELVRELDRVRAAGIALDRGESLPQLSCVAIPVSAGGGRPVAAISVSGDSGTFAHAKFEHTLRQVAFHASRALSNRTAVQGRVA